MCSASTREVDESQACPRGPPQRRSNHVENQDHDGGRVRAVQFDVGHWAEIARLHNYRQKQDPQETFGAQQHMAKKLFDPATLSGDTPSATPRRPPQIQCLSFAVPRPSAFPEEGAADRESEIISDPWPSAFPEDNSFTPRPFHSTSLGGHVKIKGGDVDAKLMKDVQGKLTRIRTLLNAERSGKMVSFIPLAAIPRYCASCRQFVEHEEPTQPSTRCPNCRKALLLIVSGAVPGPDGTNSGPASATVRCCTCCKLLLLFYSASVCQHACPH